MPTQPHASAGESAQHTSSALDQFNKLLEFRDARESDCRTLDADGCDDSVYTHRCRVCGAANQALRDFVASLASAPELSAKVAALTVEREALKEEVLIAEIMTKNVLVTLRSTESERDRLRDALDEIRDLRTKWPQWDSDDLANVSHDIAAKALGITETATPSESARLRERNALKERLRLAEDACSAAHSAMLGKVNPKHPAWGVIYAVADRATATLAQSKSQPGA